MDKEEGVKGKQSGNEIQRRAKNPKLKKPPSPPYDGLKPGWKRHTLIIRETYFQGIKDVAYWERKQVKEVVDEALKAYLNGRDIKQRPPEKR